MLSTSRTLVRANVDDNDWLTQLMNRSNLPYVNQQGACWGMSMMAILDILTANAADYDLCFHALYQHFCNGSIVTEKEHSFLKTVQLFNDPSNGTALPDAPLKHTQLTGVEPILEYLTSNALHTYMPLPFKVYVSGRLVSAYNKDSLADYLSRIQQKLMKLPASHFPFLASSIEHAIALSFDAATQQWHIRNIMKRGTSTFDSASKASEHLWKIFTELYSSAHVMFATRFFSNDEANEALSGIVDSLSKETNFDFIHTLSQKDKSRLLAFACAEGDEELVNTLLTHAVDVNYFDEAILTPLANAAINGRDHIIYKLYATGKLDLNLGWPKDQETALLKATRCNRISTVNSLLELGADATLLNKSGYTALIEACLRGLTDMVPCLLPYSTDAINTKDRQFGRTALHHAAIYGYVDIVRNLLAAGADATLRDNKNETALALAERFLKKPSIYHQPENMPRLEATIKLLKQHHEKQPTVELSELPAIATNAILFTPPMPAPTAPQRKSCVRCTLI